MTYFEDLNIIDVNAFIGNWAFRRLRHNDAAGVLGMMDDFGIERACVASADAILYRDCQAGNEKLYEETRLAPGRFWLYATLNPAYPGWERDLARCADLGFSALRLYPYYHGYALNGPEAGALIDAAAAAGWPVSVPGRVVDMRQRHWMDTTENLSVEETVEAAEAHPGATFVLTESIVSAPPDDPLWARMRALDFYVEISRMSSVLRKETQALVESLGPERILFGTGFPFKAPSPAFLKVQVLDADETVKSQIAGLNARKVFGNGGRKHGDG
ncbi:MAG: amidohydrolase family protein [Nitrospiraceae bacterium]|nr:amidohydrolase family protein [Nitrospiraceae bacterium]